MKSILLFLFTSCATFSNSRAQGLGQWFSQQATELKYYAEQIEAYQVYIGYLEKGYRIAREGLTAIRDFKKGEFSLHQVFFQSLGEVNPEIASYAKIADILSGLLEIIQNFKRSFQGGQLTASEVAYLKGVYYNLVGECGGSLNELLTILSANKWAFTDDERIRRIDRIWDDMKDKWAFCQHFVAAANLLSSQRTTEENEAAFLKSLN